jgi:dTDP-4-dehydrorhamnose 3,5-epimerase
MPFRFKRLTIPEVLLIDPQVHGDHRGIFLELYKRSEFEANGIRHAFPQANLSRSVRNVLRGLHYQCPPKAQAKAVTVVSGEIFDVAVDIRLGSPTYGEWIGVRLSDEDPQMLYIPEGFAHGFCVVSDEATVLYEVSVEYAPECEGGIAWNDPEVGIHWPVETPILSNKDAGFLPLSVARPGFSLVGGCE